jgi:transcriptional regulator with XRE-family HTH domain
MTSNRRLKQARELRGWSQAKVAEQIGTDATTVSRWERGLFSPTPYFRERLCTLFGKNAQELGLLEGSHQFRTEEYAALPDQEMPASLSPFQANGRWQQAEMSAKTIVPPATPCWPARTDTFTYILHSAAHDQQAHMLWEDAYVRAQRGQLAEAQQLGEASLSAFESVGHCNAVALREWLGQNELASSGGPPSMSPPSLPAHSEQHRFSVKQTLRRKSASATLAVILISILFLAGFSLYQLPAMLNTAPQVVHASAITNANGATQKHANSNALVLATPTATSSSTPIIKFSPTALNSKGCHLESLGYRCDVVLWFYTSNPVATSWKWQTGQATMPVLYSSTSGIGQPNQSCQLTVYINSAPGQPGQLTFIFTSSAGGTTANLSWQG